jgi:6-phosphofructokinase 1
VKRIAVLTSGGDAPGMNAAIRAVVRTAIPEGLEVSGVQRGFDGLINGWFQSMELSSVSGILNRGGTILKSARCKEFTTREGQRKAAENLRKYGIDGVITIGGSGTSRGAHALAAEWGIPTINCPSTIDNDVAGTDYTIGFYTAVTTALEAIDRIRDTATSYDRVFVVEVMGRDAGHLALSTGIGAGAEYILIPEIPYSIDDIAKEILAGKDRGKKSMIIVLAEGAGNAEKIADDITKKTGFDTRYLVIGHLQRGGAPEAIDRILASRFGNYAVKALKSGESDKMVGIEKNELVLHPIPHSWEKKKEIDRDLYQLARTLSR